MPDCLPKPQSLAYGNASSRYAKWTLAMAVTKVLILPVRTMPFISAGSDTADAGRVPQLIHTEM